MTIDVIDLHRLARGLALLLALCHCSGEHPGRVRLRLSGPMDKELDPLREPRVARLELRAQPTDALLAAAPLAAPLAAGGSVDFSAVPVGPPQHLALSARSFTGQTLGLAVARDVAINYGEESEVSFSLRRPLLFFGGGPTLLPTIPTLPFRLALRYAMQQQLAVDLREDPVAATPWLWKARLTTVDPNAGLPLLSTHDESGKRVLRYTRSLPLPTPVITAAGSNDGLSLLAVTPGMPAQLHVIDSAELTLQASHPLPMVAKTPRVLVVEPQDRWAALLSYDLPAPAAGLVGSVALLRNLAALRAGGAAVDALTIDFSSSMMDPIGVPLSAAVTPDGQLDVIFGQSPLEANQPDCAKLAAGTPSVLRSYDPQTGAQVGQRRLPYTSAISYTQAGDRVLVQPCAVYDAAKPMERAGVVQIEHRRDGGVSRLWAPGTLAVSAQGQPAALVAVGRDSSPPNNKGARTVLGAVRVLEPGRSDWSTTATFTLPNWTVPYAITTIDNDTPLPDQVTIQFGPVDFAAYQAVMTPDRTRALVAARISYDSTDVVVDTLSDGNYCAVSWAGYAYTVLLLNLQTGAREQSWMLGLQNRRCESRAMNAAGTTVGANCFTVCDSSLRGYQDGYVPSGLSALFGGG